MFGLLKTKIFAIGAAIIAALLAVIKFQSFQSKKNKERAERAEADLQFRDDVDILDNEIDQEFSRRVEEAKKDEKKIPDNLGKPNTNW